MSKHSLIRTIYLYLFAIVGLVLIVIGSVSFLDMALRAFVFTKADQEERLFRLQPPMPLGISDAPPIAEQLKNRDDLTLIQKERIGQWLRDYERWQMEQQKIDPVTARRHRDASRNLAFILIGSPLYLYHWRIIAKETREKNQSV